MRETIPAALAGERVDRVLAMLTGLPRSTVASLIDEGAVRAGGRHVSSRSRRVVEGEVLEVDVPDTTSEVLGCAPDPSVEVAVVGVDADTIVVDKPAGLVVHPGAGHDHGTLVQGLLAQFPEIAGVGEASRPGVVHRLDKGTSGLLIVARTARAYDSLRAQIAARTVDRQYVALVTGHLADPEGLIDAPIARSERDRTRMAVSARGRAARTRYRVREEFDHPASMSLVECALETGRTHQIRVHLMAVGHPVVGDVRYRTRLKLPGLNRPFLHAFRLAFDDPRTGERREFESPLAADLREVLETLRRTQV